MHTKSIKKIGVVGAGQMGSGIAQVAITRGFASVLVDSFPASLEKAKASISGSLTKLASKDRLDGQRVEDIEGRLTLAGEIAALSDCDLVIEAVPEKLETKIQVLQEIDRTLCEGALVASNTSSISITLLGSQLKKPENFIGMHFMNPVPLMELVEIIPGMATDTSVTEIITGLTKTLNKVPTFSKDFPGFIVNRILMPMINEAFFALAEGIGTPEDIDVGMKLGTNQPMGPFKLADLIGLDTCLSIMEVLHEGLGDSKYRPSPLLRKYVEAGFFGRKSGRGVYTY